MQRRSPGSTGFSINVVVICILSTLSAESKNYHYNNTFFCWNDSGVRWSFQGFHPAIRRPDQDAILDSITATARVSKRTWSFLLARAYCCGTSSMVALRRLGLRPCPLTKRRVLAKIQCIQDRFLKPRRAPRECPRRARQISGLPLIVLGYCHCH